MFSIDRVTHPKGLFVMQSALASGAGAEQPPVPSQTLKDILICGF